MFTSTTPKSRQPTLSGPQVNLDNVDFSGIQITLRPLADCATRLAKEWTWPADTARAMPADLAVANALYDNSFAWTDETLDLKKFARQIGQWGAWEYGTSHSMAADLPLSARQFASLYAWTDVTKRAT